MHTVAKKQVKVNCKKVTISKIVDLQKVKYKVKDRYEKLNRWFGIEECKSDQIIYYGTFALGIIIPLSSYIIGGIAYGF
ncbi:hypothetical protein [Bacillus cereus]|uniref:hypothetical protein n=1 Tax=Bacillus cereus TaxID=1396 RepID=UPI000BF910A7|nr:hypothetical protein [Bacillus cereus]PEQ98483.1 hypothetical protein CN477_26205 [Bacillus cereus]